MLILKKYVLPYSWRTWIRHDQVSLYFTINLLGPIFLLLLNYVQQLCGIIQSQFVAFYVTVLLIIHMGGKTTIRWQNYVTYVLTEYTIILANLFMLLNVAFSFTWNALINFGSNQGHARCDQTYMC